MSVITSDIGLLIRLCDSSLAKCLSIMAPAFNSQAIAFFAQLGITRAVLPRSLSASETRSLVRGYPQVEYEMLATCLGREYFYEHESALIRATRGFVFVRAMTPEEFYGHSRELRRRAENL